MGNINRIPSGYLSLLGSTTGGRNPPDSSDVVVPQIDFGPFLAANRLSIETLTNSPGSLPNTERLTVPQNESWILLSAGYSQTVAATNDAIQASISIRNAPGSGGNTGDAVIFVGELLDASALSVGPQFMQQAVLLPQPIVLMGGTEVRYTVNQQGVTLRTSFMTLNVIRLDS